MFPLSARVCRLISMTALLGACAQTPSPVNGGGQGMGAFMPLDRVVEPEAREVVVVINANSFAGAHAGVFVGERLYDPSGTYAGFRSEDKTWRHPTLSDYLRYHLRDGPDVRVYRFRLAEADFREIVSRIEHAGWTMPMFCASSVQTVLAGVGPFKGLEPSGWTSPNTLAARLEGLGASPYVYRPCDNPDPQPC
jgi:hypothetical protein